MTQHGHRLLQIRQDLRNKIEVLAMLPARVLRIWLPGRPGPFPQLPVANFAVPLVCTAKLTRARTHTHKHTHTKTAPLLNENLHGALHGSSAYWASAAHDDVD